jgi:hypothetical protein
MLTRVHPLMAGKMLFFEALSFSLPDPAIVQPLPGQQGFDLLCARPQAAFCLLRTIFSMHCLKARLSGKKNCGWVLARQSRMPMERKDNAFL